MAATLAGNSNLGHDLLEHDPVVGLARSDEHAEWAATAFAGQVNLARQAAAGSSDSLVGAVAGRDYPLF